jgi:hypothetical protein
MVLEIINFIKKWLLQKQAWIPEVTKTFGQQFEELCNDVASKKSRATSTMSEIIEISQESWLYYTILPKDSIYLQPINDIYKILKVRLNQNFYKQIEDKLGELEKLIKAYDEQETNELEPIADSE